MNRSRTKGTAWETAVCKYLQANGHPYAERRALSGNTDKGDIAGVPGVVIEAKSCATLDVPGWLREARQEGANAGVPVFVVWYKKKGKASAGDGVVVMDADVFLQLAAYRPAAGVPEGIKPVTMTGAAFVALLGAA